MARTTTTRLGISKPTPGTGELVDQGIDVGTNWDKVDAAVGAGSDVTEAAKPGSPWDNQLIRTTDTRRVYVWNTVENVWDLVGVYEDGIGSERVAFKATNQDKTSDTTLADVTDLQFTGVANAKYVFELLLFVTGSINGDIKIAFTFPSGAGGATITWAGYGSDAAATVQSAALFTAAIVESTTVDQALVFNAHGSGAFVRVEGFITFGSTSGLLKPRFAQNASNATATSIRPGSRIKWTRVA